MHKRLAFLAVSFVLIGFVSFVLLRRSGDEASALDTATPREASLVVEKAARPARPSAPQSAPSEISKHSVVEPVADVSSVPTSSRSAVVLTPNDFESMYSNLTREQLEVVFQSVLKNYRESSSRYLDDKFSQGDIAESTAPLGSAGPEHEGRFPDGSTKLTRTKFRQQGDVVIRQVAEVRVNDHPELQGLESEVSWLLGRIQSLDAGK